VIRDEMSPLNQNDENRVMKVKKIDEPEIVNQKKIHENREKKLELENENLKIVKLDEQKKAVEVRD
jgi:hypothetical protein